MPTIPIPDDAFDYLLARAGLSPTDAEKAELKTVIDNIAAMAERVRKPRGIMAEPALTYGFAEEDL
jgi:plasmid stabilization system protein ParE